MYFRKLIIHFNTCKSFRKGLEILNASVVEKINKRRNILNELVLKISSTSSILRPCQPLVDKVICIIDVRLWEREYFAKQYEWSSGLRILQSNIKAANISKVFLVLFRRLGWTHDFQLLSIEDNSHHHHALCKVSCRAMRGFAFRIGWWKIS